MANLAAGTSIQWHSILLKQTNILLIKKVMKENMPPYIVAKLCMVHTVAILAGLPVLYSTHWSSMNTPPDSGS